MDLNDDENIGITIYKNIISVRVNAFLHDAEGMLGSHETIGMVGRLDKTVPLTDPNELGAQWQVTDEEPMLFHTIRAPQYPERCVLPKDSEVSRRRRLYKNSAQFHRAVEACDGIIDEDMREFCIEDVIGSGDVDIAKVYFGDGFFRHLIDIFIKILSFSSSSTLEFYFFWHFKKCFCFFLIAFLQSYYKIKT